MTTIHHLTYDDVVEYVTAGLTALGYSTLNPMVNDDAGRTMPLFKPGPVSAQQLQKLDRGPIVFLQVGGGPGLAVEQILDNVFTSIRAIGPQDDYEFAETLALDIDSLMLAITSNGMIGSTNVTCVTRSGGRPALMDFDDAERYHFQATYVIQAQTGLVT
ncbi:MAG: hypothetical protein ACM3UO_00200 [Bacillota bacterium]